MADVAMPDEIVAWTKSQGWGPHHLRWHVERIWDRLPPDTIAWAQQQDGRAVRFRKAKRPMVLRSSPCIG